MSKDRKDDHIQLAFDSRTPYTNMLGTSFYEPLLSSHPNENITEQEFLGYQFKMPLWISSMTGGTERAQKINHNLARACKEFGIGMGLGSCRPLLESDQRIIDFDLRQLMGDAPLFTNFGVAQLENLIELGKLDQAFEVTKRLQANGMIIHVNPLQEWAQPEGDRFRRAPIETINIICEKTDIPLIVKEVGQGMGPESLKLLAQLPIAAIELAGHGGTNFTSLELTRRSGSISGKKSPSDYLAEVGHTAEQMISWLNELSSSPDIIISGGITNPVYGHQLMHFYQGNAVVGMASEILKHALDDYESLYKYLTELKSTFAMAKAFIKG